MFNSVDKGLARISLTKLRNFTVLRGKFKARYNRVEREMQSQAMAAVQEAILEGRDKSVISTGLQLHIISLLSVV